MARWLVLLAVPLAGLALLLAQPDIDVHWEAHPAHFWLVLGIALVNLALGYLAGEAARRLGDTRLLFVSLAFMTSAGFLGLHALATPGVLLETKNAGFVVATPVGLLLAAGFAAMSAVDLSPAHSAAVMRRARALRWGVLGLIAAWAVYSLGSLPGLDKPLPPDEADTWLIALAVVGVPLYGYAAWGYLRLYRARPALMPAAVFAALVLLAEAMIAIAFSRNWHASWWEWHVLMAIAFGLVAFAARVEYGRRRSASAVFSDLYLAHTAERVDRRYAEALEELVSALERGEPAGPTLETIRRERHLTDDEANLLEKAAGELHRLDDLFKPYLSAQLTARLRAEPALGELGGEQREVSVLFADLQGFTAFSEERSPGEVVEMLNSYWAEVVPVVAAEDGFIERFAGDAIMVVFNAASDQPDHAVRASRAAIGVAGTAEKIAAGRPDWPRFRVGVNTGPAVIGNVGAAEQRSFTAIGDTTNLAARLQAEADPGSVVIGLPTLTALGPAAVVRPLGKLDLKGKSEPVDAFVLVELTADSS